MTIIRSTRIDCGETHCFNTETQKFCTHFGVRRFGTVPICLQYNQDLQEDANYMVLRCKTCLTGTAKEDMTIKDFFVESAKYSSKYPQLRWGQTLVNFLQEVNPELHFQLTEDSDCFYDDKKIPAFYEFVISNWRA